jgi:hypothetical protein
MAVGQVGPLAVSIVRDGVGLVMELRKATSGTMKVEACESMKATTLSAAVDR